MATSVSTSYNAVTITATAMWVEVITVDYTVRREIEAVKQPPAITYT